MFWKIKIRGLNSDLDSSESKKNSGEPKSEVPIRAQVWKGIWVAIALIFWKLIELTLVNKA